MPHMPPPLTVEPSQPMCTEEQPSSSSSILDSPEVLVIGGIAVDVSCDHAPAHAAPPAIHTSNPSLITDTLGGVANNVAYALHLSGTRTRLISSVGADASGRWALEQLRHRGMDASGISISRTHSTARYIAVNDAAGNLFIAAADMRAIAALSASTLTAAIAAATPPPKFLVLDGNLSASATTAVLRHCHRAGLKIIFEPTSAAKAVLPFAAPRQQKQKQQQHHMDCYPNPMLWVAAPNVLELAAMYDAADAASLFSTELPWWGVVDALLVEGRFRDALDALARDAGVPLVQDGTLQRAIALAPYVPNLVVKLGANGCVVVRLLEPGNKLLEVRGRRRDVVVKRAREGEAVGGIYIRYFRAEEVEEGLVSVNGAGDTFLGVLVAEMVKGRGVEEGVERAQRAAVLTLGCKEAVSERVRELV